MTAEVFSPLSASNYLAFMAEVGERETYCALFMTRYGEVTIEGSRAGIEAYAETRGYVLISIGVDHETPPGVRPE